MTTWKRAFSSFRAKSTYCRLRKVEARKYEWRDIGGHHGQYRAQENLLYVIIYLECWHSLLLLGSFPSCSKCDMACVIRVAHHHGSRRTCTVSVPALPRPDHAKHGGRLDRCQADTGYDQHNKTIPVFVLRRSDTLGHSSVEQADTCRNKTFLSQFHFIKRMSRHFPHLANRQPSCLDN